MLGREVDTSRPEVVVAMAVARASLSTWLHPAQAMVSVTMCEDDFDNDAVADPLDVCPESAEVTLTDFVPIRPWSWILRVMLRLTPTGSCSTRY